MILKGLGFETHLFSRDILYFINLLTFQFLTLIFTFFLPDSDNVATKLNLYG